MKECANQADYSIPQSEQRGAEIPKTEDGQDLGVGKGWWYEGMLLTPWLGPTLPHLRVLY